MSAQRRSRTQPRIGLLGGTFDPVHNGHLAVARAARRRFRLDAVYFVPCGRPPHKGRPGLSPYLHRFTMVSLACAGEPAFLPSLLEAGPDLRGTERSYTVDTLHRLRRRLGRRIKLYFLLGTDAFLYLPQWKRFRQVVRLCDFIVADRPGFDWRRARRKVAASLGTNRAVRSSDTIQLSRSAIHFLHGVHVDISATQIRGAVRRGRRLRHQVPPAVADYIRMMGLYRQKR